MNGYSVKKKLLSVLSLSCVLFCHIQADENASSKVVSTQIHPDKSNDADGKSVTEENFNISKQLSGEDSIEGFNRAMFNANHFFIRWVFRPIGSCYGSIVPRPGIEAINRFTDNLEFVGRMLSCFCQAKFGGGGTELLRFLTNTTAGGAGFFEVADPWFGLKRQDEDFGKAFYCWGIGSGCYMFLPGPGPKNVRDTVGTVFDYAFDPKTYFYGGQSFTYLNLGTHGYATYERLALANFDTYEVLKDIGCARRRLKLTEWQPEPVKPGSDISSKKTTTSIQPQSIFSAEFKEQVIKLPGYNSQSPALDTLRVEMFDTQNDGQSLWVDLSWWNSDFPNYGSIRSVLVNGNRRKMDYKVWTQPDNLNAPMVFIIPGLGSHCLSPTACSMAEMLYNRGYSVVTLSSAMNWEFMESAATTLVPGYTPVDAEDVRNAIAAISKDLAENESIVPGRKFVIGYSLGALHTLFIAQSEMSDNRLGIDKFVAINTPVDLRYGMSRIDEYYNVWRDFGTPDEALNQGLDAMGKYMIIAKRRYPWDTDYINDKIKSNESIKAEKKPEKDTSAPDFYHVNMSERQAKLLIGYSFKRSIQEVIVCIHHQRDLGILKTPYSWGNRTPLYEELEDFTFDKYLNTFIIQYYSEKLNKRVTAEQLNNESGLRAIGAKIASNQKVNLIHTMDDFLETDSDRVWLKNTFGNRIVFFEHGGHLGNLYLGKMHESICQSLK
jgi:ABC-type transporter lipoprotein component MlaA